MNLVIDSGNTAAKVAIFEKQSMIAHKAFPTTQDLRDWMAGADFDHLLVSSVRNDAADIASWASKAKTRLTLSPTLALPVNNRYGTPDTLGMDRLAGACGAHALFPARNCLVIDVGTCVTYDFIDADANYLGGGISPGMTMRFKAMHTFTKQLPLVTPIADAPLIGTNTEASMQSGVINGMVAEMDGLINRYSTKYADLQVILCGGDAAFFENQLKASIFASPELVLIGLNSILIHNVNRS